MQSPTKRRYSALGALSFAASLPGAVFSHVIQKGFFPGGWGGSNSGVFGSSLFSGGRLPGSKLDWTKEAGDLWKNSAVGACLWYLCDTLPEAPVIVQREDAKGVKKPVANHALTTLLRRPNPHYSGSALLSSTILSLKVDGNAYWRVRRNVAGRIVQLWYVPHWCIEPRWKTADDYITHYDYYPGAGAAQEPIAPEDIIHFREGLDPENTRKGLSRLKTALREVVTDNEATTFCVSVLKNMGIPGVIISPKGEAELGKTLAERIKSLWKEKMTGDKRGEPIIMPTEVSIEAPGFSPEQMALDKIRQVPESRVCAALRVPAMVVGLSVGDNQRTYSNMREARELAYEGTIVPLQNLICDHLDIQLLPQLPGASPADFVCFDLSNVRVLQDDQDQLWKRVTLGYNAGFLMRSDARRLTGQEVDESRDAVFKTDLSTMPGAGGVPPPSTDPNAEKALVVRAAWARKARERRERFEADELEA